MIRLLVVEDHPVVRSGLAAIISDQPDFELVGEAADARQAQEVFEQCRPTVVIMDLALPDADGLELIAALRRCDHVAQFIVLTARIGSDDINRALAAGAHAYLFKDSFGEELLSAIRMVADGARYVPPKVSRKAEELPEVRALSEREREVVLWIARGFANEGIGSALEIAPQTVKSHVNSILTKLKVTNRNEAVALCLRAGVVHVENI
jgi:DNA-binding NarL/FixJ family response regulator